MKKKEIKKEKKKEKMYDPNKTSSFKMQFGFDSAQVYYVKKQWNTKSYKSSE